MNRHHEPATAAPVDPVQAAADKYGFGVPVPGLVASSPDDVLVVHLMRGDPINAIATEIETVLMPARHQFGAPVAILDAKHVEFRDRNRRLAGSVPPKGFTCAVRNTAEWHRDIALLRSCLDFREWLTTFLARWATLDGPERRAELGQFNAAAQVKAFQTPAIPYADDWRGFVAGLAREGIIVTPTGDGNLTVSNAERLTPAVRARLSANKAAILATFGAVETI